MAETQWYIKVIIQWMELLLLERFHAQEAGEPIVHGAAAFAVLWRELPLLKPLGVIARKPSILRILERAYIAFLRVRPKLQKLMS